MTHIHYTTVIDFLNGHTLFIYTSSGSLECDYCRSSCQKAGPRSPALNLARPCELPAPQCHEVGVALCWLQAWASGGFHPSAVVPWEPCSLNGNSGKLTYKKTEITGGRPCCDSWGPDTVGSQARHHRATAVAADTCMNSVQHPTWAVPEEQPCQPTNRELMYAGHCKLPKFGLICMQQKLSDRFTKKSFPPGIPVENGHHQL